MSAQQELVAIGGVWLAAALWCWRSWRGATRRGGHCGSCSVSKATRP